MWIVSFRLNFSVLLDTPKDVSRAILHPTKLITLVSHYVEYLSQFWQQTREAEDVASVGRALRLPWRVFRSKSGDFLSFPH